MSKGKNTSELQKIYLDSEACDKDHFAECRGNVRLISGDYTKRRQEALSRRFQGAQNEKLRLRISLNHTQKIIHDMTNGLISMAPGVMPAPYNETELSDIKAAELNKAVWQDAKYRQNLDRKVDEWAQSFMELGEVAVKIFWDPNKGRVVSYDQKISETGEPLFIGPDGKETTEAVRFEKSPLGIFEAPNEPAKGKANFEGELVIENIPAYDLLRAKEAKTMEDSSYLIVRKMLSVSEAKALVKDPEKRELIAKSAETTYKVFDNNSGDYGDSADEVMVKEFYFRPTPDCPGGYFYIQIGDSVTAFEGEIPFVEDLGEVGFPIKYAGYESAPGRARCKSHIRQLRPLQAEADRCGSSIGTAQITLGDDKIITSTNSKVSKGADMPGIRHIKVSGPAPTIMAGRSGEQYMAWMNTIIEMMYRISPSADDFTDTSATSDLMATLFKRMSQRAKATRYVKKFERYMIDIAKCYLALAKRYFDDDRIVMAVGKSEAINIQEFKSTQDEHFQVKILPSNDDIDSQMGTYIALTTSMQYQQDLPEDIKLKILRNLPFINKEDIFGDLFLETDTAKNMLLALDRGEDFIPHEADDPALMFKALLSRMRKSDFKLLSDEKKSRYEQILSYYQEQEQRRLKEIQEAELGFIPTGGALLSTDFQYETTGSQGQPKTERAKLPAELLEWCIEYLKKKGMAQERLQEAGNIAVQAEILNGINQQMGMDAQAGFGTPGTDMTQFMAPQMP